MLRPPAMNFTETESWGEMSSGTQKSWHVVHKQCWYLIFYLYTFRMTQWIHELYYSYELVATEHVTRKLETQINKSYETNKSSKRY